MDHRYCKCGGEVIKMWGGIQPCFYCNSCGIVTDTPGIHKQPISRELLKQVLDEIWEAVNEDMLDVEPCVMTIGYITGEVPRFSPYDLHSCGYRLYNGKIMRMYD